MKPKPLNIGDPIILSHPDKTPLHFVVVHLTRRGFTAHSINGQSHPNSSSPIKLDSSKISKELWVMGKINEKADA